MNKILSLRLIFPAFLDTNAFSCRTLSSTVSNGIRCISTTIPRYSEKDEDTKVLPEENMDIKVNPLFTINDEDTKLPPEENKNIRINRLFKNRNPRVLEQMGLAPKRKGWKFQAPRKDFYYKLVYSKSSVHIEHWSGKIVIQASTTEPNIYKYLYSKHDVSAYRNLGHLLAQRMLQAGITSVFYEADIDDTTSFKKKAFLTALKENEIELSEPDEIVHEVIPGINYSGYNRLDEPRVYRTDYQLLHKPRPNRGHRHPIRKIRVYKPKFE